MSLLDLFTTPPPVQPIEPLSLSIGPWNQGPAQEVSEFTGGNLQLTLDAGHQLSFTMPGRSPAARLSDGLTTDCWLYFGEVLLGRFRMLPLSQSWGDSGEDDVTVNAVSYKRLLAWRYLHSALEFLSHEQGNIVWKLIEHTQAQPGGNLGITKGVDTTGVLRDRQYAIGDNVLDLGINLSGVENGCWWDIDANRVYTAKMYPDFPLHPTPWELGGNILTLALTPPSGFANAVMASGDQEATVPVWVATTGVSADPRGRWEAVTASPSTIQQNTLTQHARGYLSRATRPPAVWLAEIEPHRWRTDSRYQPGDRIVVVIPPTTVDPLNTVEFDTVKAQVTEVSTTFDQHGFLGVGVTAVEGTAAVPIEETT